MLKRIFTDHAARNAAGPAALLALFITTIPLLAQRTPLRTEPALPAPPWRTQFLEIIGTDSPGVIRHGSIHSEQVERRLVLINRSSDTVRLALRGCCGCDYYPIDRELLAPNDSAHLTIGYALSSFHGRLSKVVSAEVMRRSAPLERWRTCERFDVRSEVNRILDLKLEPAWLQLDGMKAIDTTINVIVTSDRPVDVSLRRTASPFSVRVNPGDTTQRRLQPGETLRLYVHVDPVTTIGPDGPLSGEGLALTTADQHFNLIMYCIALGRQPALQR